MNASPKTSAYPKLTAAIAAITAAGRCNGRHNEHARHQRSIAYEQAIHAYADELLPAIFGGEWKLPKSGTWSLPYHWDRAVRTAWFYDHVETFRRRGSSGPQSWHNSVILSQPYNNYVLKDGDVLHPGFVTAAQALLRRDQIGVWVAPELSSHYPGNTVLVLLARGLVPEHAPLFGFRTVPDPAHLPAMPTSGFFEGV